MPKELPTILVDSREKKPLWEPGTYRGFQVDRVGLKTGDYSLAGLEDIVAIERKASANELLTNFTSDRVRFENEIERLSEFPVAVIMIEEEYSTLMSSKGYKYIKSRLKYASPAIVLHSLFSIMMLHNIHVAFVGKRGSKDFVKRFLLRVKHNYDKGFFDVY